MHVTVRMKQSINPSALNPTWSTTDECQQLPPLSSLPSKAHMPFMPAGRMFEKPRKRSCVYIKSSLDCLKQNALLYRENSPWRATTVYFSKLPKIQHFHLYSSLHSTSTPQIDTLFPQILNTIASTIIVLSWKSTYAAILCACVSMLLFS